MERLRPPTRPLSGELRFRQRLLKCVHSLHSSYHRKNKLVPPITPGGGEEVYFHNVRCWTGSTGGRNAGRDFYVAGRNRPAASGANGLAERQTVRPIHPPSPIRT
jgi:hypothetical protein